MFHNNIVSIETAWIRWACEEIDAKIIPSSTSFHTILIYDGVYCEPHYNAAKGKLDYKYARNIYHK